MPLDLSYTQIAEFLCCRYRYELRYGLGIRPRLREEAPSIGDLVHRIVADELWRQATGEAPPFTQTVEERWQFEQLRSFPFEVGSEAHNAYLSRLEGMRVDARGIAARAIGSLDFERYRTVIWEDQPMIERTLRTGSGIPARWDTYVGILDWVVEDRQSGGIWLIDFKVRKTLRSMQQEETNLQLASYQFLLSEIGIQTTGSIALQIKAEPPKRPAVNKDGSLSRARIATDWPTYLACLQERGLDPDEYLEMRDKLDVEFVRSDPVYRKPAEYHAAWWDIIVPAAQELGRIGRASYRSLGSISCQFCDYAALCLEDLRGGDTDGIIRRDFVRPSGPGAERGGV
jgi:hypothetical protein